jgi:hypothetical protein
VRPRDPRDTDADSLLPARARGRTTLHTLPHHGRCSRRESSRSNPTCVVSCGLLPKIPIVYTACVISRRFNVRRATIAPNLIDLHPVALYVRRIRDRRGIPEILLQRRLGFKRSTSRRCVPMTTEEKFRACRRRTISPGSSAQLVNEHREIRFEYFF